MTGEGLFKDWLKQQRKSLDLTQSELAHQVGCSIYTVQKIEEGTARPSRQLAELLLLHLEVSPEERPILIRWARSMGAEAHPGAIAGAEGGATSASAAVLSNSVNPYKGLRAFQEADAPDFFGREMLTRRLCERLAEETELSRFLAVVGPSGAGKSSVVRAGLLPLLRHQLLPGGFDPVVVDLIPGPHPLEELESALLRSAANPPPSLMEQMWGDEHGLTRAVSRVLPDEKSELLLVIDQFEELFTLVTDERVRTQFIDSIFAGVADARSRLRVVVTLRADFYDRPLVYLPASELLGRRTEIVGPLTSDEMYQAITGPAERHGLELEIGLVATIMQDVTEQPGALPLLQYALTELYERREGRLLTLAGYKASGGVFGSLARRADILFSGLSQEEQAETRQLFLRLVTPGEGMEDTRRRVLRSELQSATKDEAALRRVLDLFGRYRMLTFDRDPLAQSPTVDVAHEALLRSWRRLHDWLNESREGLLVQRRLMSSAAEWQASGQERSFLASGVRLAQFAALQEEAGETGALALTGDEQAYLAASKQEQQQREATEQERDARELSLQKRAAQQLRYLAAGLAVFLLLAAGLAAWALNRSQVAQDNLAHADALRLASTANNLLLLHGDLQLIALLSVRSMNTEYSSQADAALSNVAFQGIPPRVFAGHTAVVRMAKFSPDGKYLVTASDDRTARLWDVATGKTIRIFSGHMAPVGGVAFSPDGKYLVTASDDRTARLWDVATAQTLRVFTGSSSAIGWPYFSPDGKYLLIDDGPSPHIWDVATAQMILTFTGHTDQAFPAYSPDGKYIFTGSLDGTERLWDASTGQQIRVFSGLTGLCGAVAYSPDGRYVAAGGGAGPDGPSTQIAVWDVASGQQVQLLSGLQGVLGIAFSHDSRFLVSGGEDATVRLWDIASGQMVHNFLGHTQGIFWVTFSPDSKLVASAGRDDTARVWSLQTGLGALVFTGHTDTVNQATFSPDGKKMVTASNDHTARIWDAASGQQLLVLSHPDAVRGAVFSPDGKMVLTAGADKITRLWDATNLTGSASVSDKPLLTFVGHTAEVRKAVFSPDGNYIVTVSFDGTARVWDAHTAEPLVTYTEQGPAWLYRVAFSPNGKMVATAGEDGTARIWDPQTGKELQVLHVLQGNTGSVADVAFSPDSNYLLTTGLDKAARLWDVATGEELRAFRGHTGQVLGAAFSPDGKIVLTTGDDETARLWDPQSGKELRSFVGHDGGVSTAVFSPDGKYILTSSDDKTARLWFTDYQDTISYVCGLLTRDLTPDERAKYDIRDQEPTCP